MPDDYASDTTTLVGLVDAFEHEGYSGQVVPAGEGRVRCLSCEAEYSAGRLRIDGQRRTEGASDPADMSMVVAAACPECGARATMVLAFGPDAAPEEQDVLIAIPAAPAQHGRNPAGAQGDP